MSESIKEKQVVEKLPAPEQVEDDDYFEDFTEESEYFHHKHVKAEIAFSARVFSFRIFSQELRVYIFRLRWQVFFHLHLIAFIYH